MFSSSHSRSLEATFKVAAIAVSTALTACHGGEHGNAGAADRLFSDPRLHRLHIGLDEHAPPEGTLGLIVAARVTEGGRHVVVLDFVPPFVKVFDGGGRLQHAFLKSGQGPGEARHPIALAVSGDSAVLVADATGRLMVFGLGGELRTEGVVPQLAPLAAAPGCEGDWVVYGPRFVHGSHTPTWLHRIRFGAAGSVASRDALPDSLASEMLPQGVAYGLTADAGRAVAWHTLGAKNLLAAWPCGDAPPQILASASRSEGAAKIRRHGRGLRMEIGPGARARGGTAAVPGGVVVAEQVLGKDAGSVRTELTLLRRDGGSRTVSVPGRYALRDSRTGTGVLVSTTDPVPQVFLVSESDLLQVFGH